VNNYTYNALNQLIQVSMPRDNCVTRRAALCGTAPSDERYEPGERHVTYTYNQDGTLASKSDAKNQQVTTPTTPTSE